MQAAACPSRGPGCRAAGRRCDVDELQRLRRQLRQRARQHARVSALRRLPTMTPTYSACRVLLMRMRGCPASCECERRIRRAPRCTRPGCRGSADGRRRRSRDAGAFGSARASSAAGARRCVRVVLAVDDERRHIESLQIASMCGRAQSSAMQVVAGIAADDLAAAMLRCGIARVQRMNGCSSHCLRNASMPSRAMSSRYAAIGISPAPISNGDARSRGGPSRTEAAVC